MPIGYLVILFSIGYPCLITYDINKFGTSPNLGKDSYYSGKMGLWSVVCGNTKTIEDRKWKIEINWL